MHLVVSQKALDWSADEQRKTKKLFLVGIHLSVRISLPRSSIFNLPFVVHQKKNPLATFLIERRKKKLSYENQLLNLLPVILLLESKLKAAVPSCLQTHPYGKHRVNTQLMESKAFCVRQLRPQQVHKKRTVRLNQS